MATTPKLALPYPIGDDTPDVPRDIRALAEKLDDVITPTVYVPQLVTSLPGTPADGQEVYYVADAANGVLWHLRYRAAASGSFKWEYLGGTELYAANDASVTGITSAAYIAPTGPMALTLPLAGDYMMTVMANTWNATAGFYNAYLSYAASGDSQATADARAAASAIASVSASVSKTTRVNGVTAGRVYDERVRVDSGGSASISGRRLMARPVRVS